MTEKTVRKVLSAVFCVTAAGASMSAMATAHAEVQASAVLIQSYGGVAPTLFYAGSVCTLGHLTLDPNDTQDRQKLLWASVLSAKATGGKVNFDYDYNGDDCVIRAFAVMPN